jgi:hypothetical protein
MSRAGSTWVVVVSFPIFLGCGSNRPAVSGTGGQGGETGIGGSGGAVDSGVDRLTADAANDGAPGTSDGGSMSTGCDDVTAGFVAPVINPNGPWSYGWSTTLSAPFTVYTAFSENGYANIPGSAGVLWWYINTSPSLCFNPMAAMYTFSGITLGPGALGMHPGPAGQYSIARWTAPATGRYVVTATFSGIQTPLTTTDVHVRHNQSDLPSGAGFINVNNMGNVFTFPASSVDVMAGDTIDFAVGFGNGTYIQDTTGLTASVCH